jgi:nucleotide-binding universal stress UspA family protein
MFKKILYPTDFSEPATKLVEAIDELKKVGLREIVLTHIIDIRNVLGMTQQLEKQAMQALGGIKNQLGEKKLKVKTCLKVGVPFIEIVELAKKEKVSMILMGSHGKGFVKQMVLGSTSDNVLRHATVPVLIVRLQMVERPGKPVKFIYRRMLRKILCPTDFSDCAWKALRYVKKLGEAGAKKAVVMHVQDVRKRVPEIMEKLPEYDRIDLQVLNKIKHELEVTGMRVKTLLTEGIPFVEINRVAEEEDASLIVMGSHGRSMVKEMLLGSVCGKVVRRTTRPVLIIRRDMPE